MKVNGSVQPAALLFEHRFDGTAEMRFRENITSSKDENGSTIFTYDEYFLKMPDRDGLEKIVQDNTATWLAYAKQQEAEKQAQVIRDKRDKLLSDTDWTQADDAPLSTEDRESMRKYRQDLRNITTQSTFPQTIQWPEKPITSTVANQSTKLDLLEQTIKLQAQVAQLQINSEKS